jgi:cytochrome c oxidase cbb3-type subunit III
MKVLAWCTVLLFALPGCEREMRRFDAPARVPERNAFDVAQGKRLFRWYNCNGCHGSGGGNMGPALSDGYWRYGAGFDSVVASIRDGRPNGMPSFAGRIPEEQQRQIAAYVRSISGQLQADVAPSRSDSLSSGEPESRREREAPTPEAPASGALPASAPFTPGPRS